MAKVKGPLFSVSAAGKISNAIVFQKTPGGFKVNEYVVPRNPRTDLQIAHRQLYAAAVGVWKDFSPNTKSLLKNANPIKNISAYAYFVSLFVTSSESQLTYNQSKYFSGVYY